MSPHPLQALAPAMFDRLRPSGLSKGTSGAVLALILCLAPAHLRAEPQPPIDAPSGDAPARHSAAGNQVARERSRGDGAEIVLPALTVSGRGITGTDPVPSIVARVTAAGTKTDTPLITVPQAVSVIPRVQIDQQAARSVGDSVRYTPGVFADTRVGGVLESVFLRGFGGFAAGATNPQILDGLPLVKGGNWAAQVIDPAVLERVEVLRGPASVLYGQASPGGLIAMVSKRPTEQPFRAVTLTTGNRNRAEAAFDLGGPITEDGRWAYRLNGLGRWVDTQADFSREQRLVLAPALAWRPDEDTHLTLLGFYQNDPDNNFSGWLPAEGTLVPNPAGRIRRRFFPGEPGFDAYDRQQYMAGYAFEHRFDATWAVRQNLRYAHIDTRFEGVAINYFAPFGATSSLLERSASWSREAVDGVSLENQVQADFATGPIGHTLLLGLGYQGSRADVNASGFGPVPAIDFAAPVYGRPFARPPAVPRTHQDWSRVGLYAQDQMRLDNWVVTIGGRQDWSLLDTTTRSAARTSTQDDQAFTGRVGAVYLFDSGLAPYASYATSFEPTLGTGFSGAPFKPTHARQTEAGVKYQPPGLESFVAVSAFDITQDNVATADSAHPFYSVQTGAVRSRGIEFEARATLSDSLDLIGAYTYLDTTVRRDSNLALVGKRFVAVPDQLVSLWANYRFPGGPLAGLSLAGGIRAIGRSAGDPANSFSVPDATLFDAAIRYDLGAADPGLAGWQVSVNAANLFDRTYLASCFAAGGCFYGNGRTVIASLGYRW
ncbi:TonB-dependent siderophore receptor [Methylobacterium pseudosasicola]|uniref:Iron complex outermembrane recepter protein n=1 Tax=Methylobacterium pseudosasicola TaxID=582667 RepID=A0A1I4JWH8_9HYPH|nr:TonB-dependent siderophore receptor [Methylobacterium pseudosasicola]SFL70711.1 iron complex outermembrane recepter protein [Methylobacterium pseudosasicola]